MNLKGINEQCKNNAMELAFRKGGYKLRKKAVSWPRLKGPATVQVDCSKVVCNNALFLVEVK